MTKLNHDYSVSYSREANDDDRDGSGFVGITPEGTLMELNSAIPPNGVALLRGDSGNPTHFTRTISEDGKRAIIKAINVSQRMIELNKNNPAFSDVKVVSPSGEISHY